MDGRHGEGVKKQRVLSLRPAFLQPRLCGAVSVLADNGESWLAESAVGMSGTQPPREGEAAPPRSCSSGRDVAETVAAAWNSHLN